MSATLLTAVGGTRWETSVAFTTDLEKVESRRGEEALGFRT